jgi:hypothetical protein
MNKAVCGRFDHDQYQLHMKQLDNLRQTTSVAEYHAKFEQLAHSVMLYNPSYDDTFLVVRFLSGLKDEISAPIALHHPKDVDTARPLLYCRKKSWSPKDGILISNMIIKTLLGLAARFSAWDKAKPSARKDEGKNLDKQQGEDKLAALLAHRKANGLCFTCGEKWTGKSHKCPDQVSIHVLMEVLQTMQDDSSSDSEDSDKSAETFEECVLPIHAIPQPAQPLKRKRTMRLRGWRGKQDLPILLDSSSAGTFVSEVVAQQCQSQMQDTNSSQFTTADGSPLFLIR